MIIGSDIIRTTLGTITEDQLYYACSEVSATGNMLEVGSAGSGAGEGALCGTLRELPWHHGRGGRTGGQRA